MNSYFQTPPVVKNLIIINALVYTNTWENSSAHIHSMGVMGKRSALTTSDFVNFAEDFVENPEKKILQVFDAVSKFQSLCVTYGIDKAISDKIQHVLDGLVTDDLNLLQLT